jgi:NAD(P)-dependent dehydrogenase (short-subunit alcohol dehydrogenase family)
MTTVEEPSPVLRTPGGLVQGKVAVITGAGVGIGRACVEVFVAEGAKVLAADFTGQQEKTAADLGDAVSPFQADMRREDDIQAMIGRAVEVFGRIDVLINVAGNPGGRRAEEVTAEEYEDLTSVHLRGTMLADKYAARAMAATGGGAIVNFSSAASFGVDKLISPAYAASKAGINALTRMFAVQYGPRSIRVNAVAPGFTLSTKNLAAPADVRAQLEGRSALGRGGRPEEQAYVAAFLASDLASFVTGVVVPVDGGWTVKLA